MKIVSYMRPMRLLILDNGGSVYVDDYPEFRVGMEIECVDGVYKLATQAAECET